MGLVLKSAEILEGLGRIRELSSVPDDFGTIERLLGPGMTAAYYFPETAALMDALETGRGAAKALELLKRRATDEGLRTRFASLFGPSGRLDLRGFAERSLYLSDLADSFPDPVRAVALTTGDPSLLPAEIPSVLGALLTFQLGATVEIALDTAFRIGNSLLPLALPSLHDPGPGESIDWILRKLPPRWPEALADARSVFDQLHVPPEVHSVGWFVPPRGWATLEVDPENRSIEASVETHRPDREVIIRVLTRSDGDVWMQRGIELFHNPSISFAVPRRWAVRSEGEIGDRLLDPKAPQFLILPGTVVELKGIKGRFGEVSLSELLSAIPRRNPLRRFLRRGPKIMGVTSENAEAVDRYVRRRLL